MLAPESQPQPRLTSIGNELDSLFFSSSESDATTTESVEIVGHQTTTNSSDDIKSLIYALGQINNSLEWNNEHNFEVFVDGWKVFLSSANYWKKETNFLSSSCFRLFEEEFLVARKKIVSKERIEVNKPLIAKIFEDVSSIKVAFDREKSFHIARIHVISL